MKKKNMIALAGLVAVCGVGGTLAYFNQTMEAENAFDTGKFGSTLVEDFKPSEGQNWEPGATVNKVVEVKNTGDLPVVVRIKMDETWVNKTNGELVKKTSTTEDVAAGVNKLVNIYQEDDSDGLWAADDSVVMKAISDSGNWVFQNGYYYYKNEVGAGGTTGAFLNSVTLIEAVDMGQYEEKKYYTTDKDEATANWIEWPTKKGEDGQPVEDYVAASELEDAVGKAVYKEIEHFKSEIIPGTNPGYSNADYTLTITAQTVQATADAVEAVFRDEFAKDKFNWTFLKDNN